MKRLAVLIASFVFLPLLVAQAATQVDPQDFGKLVQVVKGQDQDIDRITRILQGMDTTISGLKTQVQNMPRGGSGGGSGNSQSSSPAAIQDSQARQIGNRALAWALYSQVADAKGNKPDIEDVERMLTPLEKGNMSPASFEAGLAAGLKKNGWRLVNCEKPLSDTEIKKIVDEAIGKALLDLTKRVTTLEGEVAELKKAVREAKDLAFQADGKADKALTAVAGIEIPKPVVIDTSGFATKVELDGVRSSIPDTSCLATKVELKQTSDCLEGKINDVKKESEAVQRALVRTLNTDEKSLARAELYASLMEKYQAKGYSGGALHAMVQLYLRAAYWSEKLIKKAAEENGAKLVSIDQLPAAAQQ